MPFYGEGKGGNMYKQMTLKVKDLIPYPIRGLRENVLERLRGRIKERGYNVAKCLIVVKMDSKYYVADGNHRLKVLQEENIEEVPCVVYEDIDIYRIAVESNQDEDVYASMDLFDWLDVIRKLKDEGHTQQEIGDRIGWSRQQVSQYSMLIDKIATTILKTTKVYQNGRVAENATTVTFNFTERWFRDSGLYDIPEYQERLIKAFISDNFNWNKAKVQTEAAKYKQWQAFIKIAEDTLVNKENDIETIITLIESGIFKTEKQLRQKINDLNSKAQNKLIHGDAVIELAKLEDACIDVVITDPPYGIDYKSNRSKYEDHVTKQTIQNDGKEAFKLLNDVCSLLNVKTKSDAHIYIFTSWKVYPEFKEIIEKYFTVRNLIVWDKGNHGAGDLENAWGNRHELVIFATKGNRPLNKRKADIVSINKLPSSQMIHPTQKPVELITELLEVSAQKADTVCDPFMGSGSTIKAVKEYGGLNYIGIEIDKEIFEKAQTFIGGGVIERNRTKDN
jgi:site-specific DNA-methyltransferase (adenine-specific)